MAKILRSFFSNISGLVSYPRSVFDMRPVDLSHFSHQDDASALCGDWMDVCNDVKKVAWRVYVRV